jgi:hypothetical protein
MVEDAARSLGACRRDLQRPEDAMPRYVEWVESLPGKPVFVAFPAGFDFTWMFWYMMRFVGRSPFGWAALDIKTVGFALTGLPYRKAVKAAFPPIGTIRCPIRTWRSTTRSSRGAVLQHADRTARAGSRPGCPAPGGGHIGKRSQTRSVNVGSLSVHLRPNRRTALVRQPTPV